MSKGEYMHDCFKCKRLSTRKDDRSMEFWVCKRPGGDVDMIESKSALPTGECKWYIEAYNSDKPLEDNKKDLKDSDLTCENWREYDFHSRVYRINDPVSLFISPGGLNHRVVDAKGIVHCVPGPGTNGCVLRWEPKDANNPVSF